MANLNLNTDSPLSRRIVRAFLNFLNSVEPAPGVDIEGLEVVTECLTEVFKLDSSSVNDHTKPDLLVDIFRSLERNENQEIRIDSGNGAISEDAPSSSSAQNAADAKLTEAEEWMRNPQVSGRVMFFSLLESRIPSVICKLDIEKAYDGFWISHMLFADDTNSILFYDVDLEQLLYIRNVLTCLEIVIDWGFGNDVSWYAFGDLFLVFVGFVGGDPFMEVCACWEVWGEWCTKRVLGSHGCGLWMSIIMGWDAFAQYLESVVGMGNWNDAVSMVWDVTFVRNFNDWEVEGVVACLNLLDSHVPSREDADGSGGG
uniref:SGTA homodimerisation domain-containing protein n=1 Tax=Fagus sylvatica TaxID=28930 RepID=A0A2N9HJL9_FAGSY